MLSQPTLIHELTYSPDSAILFARIANQPWAIYLDSGRPQSQYGRYDILTANPFITLSTVDGETKISSADRVDTSSADPFALLKTTLEAYKVTNSGLPFEGGAIGYFGYDLARRLEHMPSSALDGEHIPQMMVGIYDWAVVVDHKTQKSCLVSHGFNPATHTQWQGLCDLFDAPLEIPESTFEVVSEVVSNMDLPAYEKAFEKIQHYIHEGDCYQVNLAQRFSASAMGNAWTAYEYLREISPAPFLAYMNLPGLQVLSASPERFLQVSGRHVETRPIKGTRPRAADAEEDAKNAQELEASLKDRAENLMIVDLLRNDISKSCAVGSVKAERLFALESFANVHHLVSTVTGKLASGNTAIDLLRGCFPGGSITGAPKLRAIEIIEELEPHRRGLYCGAIGYIGFDGNMDTNITIRTAVYSDGEIRFWAGGGIVADSEMQKEYRETWDKASSMLELMQHFGKNNNGS
ncbi:aminodeoxychorismate synthase, component I [Methylovorus sp. MM2]|uniref:aminodeoxychorismate synthase component I n=1 Tax=Methylovorus sp. MM2 TaxID=1848038 RepID=UPI0007E2A312|nr:aminodeoxychorismate synthase component I [Methylovorus sp. MM2]OAM52890.1 aminodeoxychorismate synthase, component I [Methylovorus sp. MM2]